ncbi:MAG: hypothetical protein ACJA0Q_002209, partial [Saprospiraceae bacterium]
MYQKIIFLLITLVFGLTAQGQDTLLLLNGKAQIVKVSHETSDYVIYQKIKRGDTTN